MEEINLTREISIYRTSFKDFPKEKLIEEAYCNNDLRAIPPNPQDLSPGFQSDVHIVSGKLEEYSRLSNNKVITEFYPNSNNKFGFKNWLYISNKTTVTTFYHSHIEMPNIKSKGNWTWTYYIQVPNHLKDEEGKLSFLVNKDEIFNVLPNEGDLLIFPASLLHMPLPAPNSTKDRIVLAGTLSKLDLAHRYTKSKTSLI